MYPARSTFGECSRSLFDSSFDESFASLRNSSGGGFNRFSSIDSTGFSSITSIANSQFEEQNSLYGRGFYESQEERGWEVQLQKYNCFVSETGTWNDETSFLASEQDPQTFRKEKRKNIYPADFVNLQPQEHETWVSSKKRNGVHAPVVAAPQPLVSSENPYTNILRSLRCAIEMNKMNLPKIVMNTLEDSRSGPRLWENLLQNDGYSLGFSRKTLKEITQFFIQKAQSVTSRRYFNSMYERMDKLYSDPDKESFHQFIHRAGILQISHHIMRRMLITFIKRNTTLISQTPLAPHVERFFKGQDLNRQGEVRQPLNNDYHPETLAEVSEEQRENTKKMQLFFVLEKAFMKKAPDIQFVAHNQASQQFLKRLTTKITHPTMKMFYKQRIIFKALPE